MLKNMGLRFIVCLVRRLEVAKALGRKKEKDTLFGVE